jgi:hypothetical protein
MDYIVVGVTTLESPFDNYDKIAEDLPNLEIGAARGSH